MTRRDNPPEIPLPRDWPGRVKSAMLHVISLAQFALAHPRDWAVNSRIARVRLKTDNGRLRQQTALLTEEIRIKDARMKRIAAPNRLHYTPTERMAILELRAARAWSTHEEGPDALIQIHERVNKFPDFVR